ncbi:MAG: ATPase V [Bacteroidales bacterium]|nr:ATPase V [Bacteroidales bacterium]
MIREMTKYSFVIFHNDVPEFLKKLQELGVMDITRSSKPATSTSKQLFSDISRYSASLKSLNQIKKEYAAALSEKKSEAEVTDAETAVKKCESLTKQRRELKAQIAELSVSYKEALPWGDFNEDTIEKIKSLSLTPHFISLQKKKFDEKLKEQYPLQIISETQDKVYFVILTEPDQSIKGKFKEVQTPSRCATEIEGNIKQLKQQYKKATDELISLTSATDSISEKIKSLSQEADLFLAKEGSTKKAEQTLEVFTGFAPTECTETITNALDNDSVYYIKEEAKLEDNPPISLKNNRFTRMFTILTDMYGRPAYNEFDPTPYISVFFLLFFAMCMGDAGYGILLILIALLLRRSKGTKEYAPLVMTLGIATVVVGFLLHTFFGIDISQASWVPEGAKKFMITGKIAGYDSQMVLALAIGVLHICIAMVVKAVYATKKNGFANSLGTWGWTLLIVGGVITGAIALAGVIDQSLTKTIVIVIGIISALGIFLLNDLHRNPLKNIGSGLWETYNTVTGLLGDVLSYIRLYALGLAGGMLGAAFNQLGGMVLGDSTGFNAMWIFFIIIVVFGHVLNLAMCCLGAFVHPLRLNFLEFFKNSGYEGSGKTYKPLTNK